MNGISCNMLYLNELPSPPRKMQFPRRQQRQRQPHHQQQQQQQQHHHNEYLRHLKQKRGCNILRNKAVLRRLLPYFREYCETSSIHGIRYLTNTKLLPIERVIWLLILLATSMYTIFVYIDLSVLYNSAELRTTVDDSVFPTYRISFPSIGLCPHNRIDFQKLYQDAPERFLGTNVSQELRTAFIEFFDAMSLVRLGRLLHLSTIFENATLAAQVKALDGLNIQEVMRYLMLDMDKIFNGPCIWNRLPYNCSELFELERTEAGFCYIFNSLISPEMQERRRQDSYYPYRTSSFGEGQGLDFNLVLNKSKLRRNLQLARGTRIMVKIPDQWYESVRAVPHDSYTKVIIAPRLAITSEQTRKIPPDVRRCVFDDETDSPFYKTIPGLRYWRRNCRTRCHQDYVNQYCNCTPSLLFPISEKDNYTDCKASDFKCLYDNREVFAYERQKNERKYVKDIGRNTMVCNCLNNCVQMIYDVTLSTDTIESSQATTQNDTEMDHIHLDIFYHSQYLIQYGTRLRYTFVELLANFGGIIGLFLGASILSAIELAYYFTIGLYLYLHDMWGRKKREKSTSNSVLIRKSKIAFINKSFNDKENLY